MGYPSEMRESIKILESTRPARLKQQIPRMTFEQREELLHQFHPDYRPEGIAVVRVGPNQGQKMNKQFVEVLEARSRLDPD
ncbi:MAG: succinate dehydrogenase/fumarate reductase flavoprotein subunit, partial [Actinobacteria bacterium]|nr:succinate dehydrogenase/fumarate reductase flavoprotein subunit [Actinomycetota bacterium]